MVFAPRRRRSDPEVTHLIDQIRDLVAQQRRLEGGRGEQTASRRRHEDGELLRGHLRRGVVVHLRTAHEDLQWIGFAADSRLGGPVAPVKSLVLALGPVA